MWTRNKASIDKPDLTGHLRPEAEAPSLRSGPGMISMSCQGPRPEDMPIPRRGKPELDGAEVPARCSHNRRSGGSRCWSTWKICQTGSRERGLRVLPSWGDGWSMTSRSSARCIRESRTTASRSRQHTGRPTVPRFSRPPRYRRADGVVWAGTESHRLPGLPSSPIRRCGVGGPTGRGLACSRCFRQRSSAARAPHFQSSIRRLHLRGSSRSRSSRSGGPQRQHMEQHPAS